MWIESLAKKKKVEKSLKQNYRQFLKQECLKEELPDIGTFKDFVSVSVMFVYNSKNCTADEDSLYPAPQKWQIL